MSVTSSPPSAQYASPLASPPVRLTSSTRLNIRTASLSDAHPFVYFEAERFACGVCGFHLDSVAEWKAIEMESRWEVEGVDWREIDPPLNEDQIAAAEDWANTEDA